MGKLPLACRVYRIEKTLQREVEDLLLKSPVDTPLRYNTIQTPAGNNLELSIVIKSRMKNNYGTAILFSVDEVMSLIDREFDEQIVRYFRDYELQVIQEKAYFDHHIMIFGPKAIDAHLVKAIRNRLKRTEDERVPDPLILRTVDLKANMAGLMDAFPNLQHFCIRDIPDVRMSGIVVKGNSLEETDVFDRFVRDADTSGDVNFLGITLEFGKLIYIGSDGSVYSRMNFAGEDRVKIIYDMYVKLQRLGAFNKALDE